MARLWKDGDVLVLDTEEWETPLAKMVPASRWSLARKRWEIPAAWGNAVALRGVFGDKLTLADDVIQWGNRERQSVMARDSVKRMAPPGEYGYQVAGTDFLSAAGNALLGDDMGLGKTKQTIDALEIREEYPALIVCPNSLKYTWKEEFKKWAPNRSVTILSGTLTQKLKALNGDSDVVVVNYESLRGLARLAPYGSIKLSEKEKQPGPLNRPWAAVVADEAHRVKDPKAKQTRALWSIASNAGMRIALTGTPVANSPEDLWSLMHFVSPEEWPSKVKFIDRYCDLATNFWSGGAEAVGYKRETKEELYSILDPRFLRRTKEEVLTQLPPLTRSTRLVDLGPKQRKAYDQLEKEMLAELDSGILVAADPMVQVLRLLQASAAYPELDEGGSVTGLSTPSAKIDVAKELADETDMPLVFFAVSRKFADLLAHSLGASVIHGGVDPRQRADLVDRFQGGDITRLVLTTGTGAEGLTLTAASTAVFMQRPWSLVQSKQAEARIHRIGQTRPAEILDVVAANTVEEAVIGALTGKEELLQEVLRDKERLARLLRKGEL